MGGTKQQFLVLTAHVKSGDSKKDRPVKIAQGQEVARIMTDAQQKTLPAIFACDFNNAPNGEAHCAFFKQLRAAGTDVTSAYSKVLGKLQNTRTTGASDDWRKCTTPTYDEMVAAEPAFTTKKWRKGGAQKDKRGKTAEAIDYIFYTQEFECSQVLDITKEPIEPLYMPGWRYPS